MKGMKYILSFVFAACSLWVTAQDLVQYVDTRVGTAASTTQTAGMFGKKTEEFGQTLPAVLEPNERHEFLDAADYRYRVEMQSSLLL